MPKYLVSTRNVSEVIEAGSIESAVAMSSYASLHDAASAQLLEPSPVDTVTPSAGAPEASTVPPPQTAGLSGDASAEPSAG